MKNLTDEQIEQIAVRVAEKIGNRIVYVPQPAYPVQFPPYSPMPRVWC